MCWMQSEVAITHSNFITLSLRELLIDNTLGQLILPGSDWKAVRNCLNSILGAWALFLITAAKIDGIVFCHFYEENATYVQFLKEA